MSRNIPVFLGWSELGLKPEDFLPSGRVDQIKKSTGRDVETESLDGDVLDALLKDIRADVMVDVVWTRYAWPHVEMKHWHKFLFLNYCLEGRHTFGQVGQVGQVAGRGLVEKCGVNRGSCFVVDPRRTHWLEPVGESAEMCLLLQFAVPRRDKKTFRNIVDWIGLPF